MSESNGPGNPGRNVEVQIASDGYGLDRSSLVKFVLNAKVDLLRTRRFADGAWLPAFKRQSSGDSETVLLQREIATHLKMSASSLSKFLDGDPSYENVVEFEHNLFVFALTFRRASPQAARDLGWLTSFRQEMLEEPLSSRPNVLLGRWHADLAEAGPHNAAEALVLGEALLAQLQAARSAEVARSIWIALPSAGRTGRALVAIASRPPGRGSMPAIHAAAQLGAEVLNVVEEHVWRSPVGFRAIRILTRILQIGSGPQRPSWWSTNGDSEIDATWVLILRIADQPVGLLPDPYPARSFLVEALRQGLESHHPAKSAKMRRSAVLRLWRLLRTDLRPVRERMYAAYALAVSDQRLNQWVQAAVAVAQPNDDGFEYLAALLALMESGNPTMRTAEQILMSRVLPRELSRRPEVRIVESAIRTKRSAEASLAASLLAALPPQIRRELNRLVRYALLSPNGTVRRQACDTIREAGLAIEAIEIIGDVLRTPGAPRWLREISCFLLGYLTHADAHPLLIGALKDPDASVVHAAAFALGDIAEPTKDVVGALLNLAADDPDRCTEVARATAYALSILHPRRDDDGAGEHHDVLNTLAKHPDSLTACTAAWGLELTARTRARNDHRPHTEIWGLTDLPRFSASVED